MDKPKILLVEDDLNFGNVLKNYLELNDYDVTLCRDGVEGKESFLKNKYDLCILDVMMPKKDGFMLAEEIRMNNKEIPIIFLTAKTMKEDVLRGFRIGADDYLTKPFDSDVLLHKLKAILKRSTDTDIAFNQSEFKIGKYKFNYEHRLIVNDGNQQKLSPKEAELLRMLCTHINDVLPRDKTLKTIWGDDNYFTARSMDVFITKLRKYFKDDPNIDIINIHSKGFKMVDKSF